MNLLELFGAEILRMFSSLFFASMGEPMQAE